MSISLPRPRPAAPAAELRQWSPWLWAQIATAAALLGLLIGVLATMFIARGPFAGQEYHLWRWQAENFTSSAFSLLGITSPPDAGRGDEALRAYFRLTSQLRAAESADTPDLALIAALENERRTYENDVERLIETRLDAVVAEAGLRERLPLFSAIELTWPPVDLELTSPPRLLVRSPRDRIRRAGDTLLKNDLTLADIERIEAKADDEDTVSIVVSIGGLAAYPAIVRDDRSYDSLLETAAHEWVHHYLAFYPLGRQWGKGGDAEALNETTADLAGRELANLVRRRHPLELSAGEDGRAPAGPAPTIDFTAEMRRLRLEVDALLAAGQVAEAERLMEERRQYFEQHNIFIRKLNQAYFAFYGTYAAGPASSNPIGEKIDRVWAHTRDVGVFLKLMREVETTAELDALLARLEAQPLPR